MRMVLGFGLVILGIVGLILPVMPGWIFLIPGLLILGDYFPPIRRLVDWAKRRFAEADQQFRKHRTESTSQPDGSAPVEDRIHEDSEEVVAGGDRKSQQ